MAQLSVSTCPARPLAALIVALVLVAPAHSRADSWSTIVPVTAGLETSYDNAFYDASQSRFIVFSRYSGTLQTVTRDGFVTTLTPSGTAFGGVEHAVAYDTARNRIMVYGGGSGYGGNDVWTVNLTGSPAWTEVAVVGSRPSIRRDATLVYDSVGDRLILFGGYYYDGTNITRYNDVWTLPLAGPDSLRWNSVTTSGTPPVGRNGAAAIFDPTRNQMVIHGGDQSPGSYNRPSDELWTLSMGMSQPQWEMSAATGPAARMFHSIVYDSSDDRLLLFGGSSNLAPGNHLYNLANDTWSYALAAKTWSKLTPAGALPTPRRLGGVAVTTDPVELWVMGGLTDNEGGSAYTMDLWRLPMGPSPVWSGVAIINVTPPSHSNVGMWDSNRGRMIMLGQGPTVAVLSTALDPTWTLYTPVFFNALPQSATPAFRAYFSAIYDPLRDRILMFGGLVAGSTFSNDVWAYDVTSGAWSLLATAGAPPSGRYGHVAVYDPNHDRMVVYGGNTSAGFADEVWELNLESTPSWHQLTPTGSPGSQYYNAAIYDALRDRMILVHNDRVSALWLGDMPAWTPVNAGGAVPTPRSGATAIYDPTRDRLVHFGGTYYDDTHALSLGLIPTWTLLPPAPQRHSGHTSVYDPIHDRMLVFGGSRDRFSGATPVVEALAFDTPQTPTLASLVSSQVDAGRVFLRWNAHGLDGPVLVERRHVPDDSWRTLGVAAREGRDDLVYQDRSVVPGHVYDYRLRLMVAGVEQRAGEVRVEIPYVFALAMERAWRDASSRVLRVSFTLPSNARTTIECFDVGGRRVVSRRFDPPADGRHELTIPEGASLRPGVYVIRVLQGGARAVQRIVITS